MMEQKKIDYIINFLERHKEMIGDGEFPCLDESEINETMVDIENLVKEVQELGKYGHCQDLDDYDTGATPEVSGRRQVHHCQGVLYDPDNNFMFSYNEYGSEYHWYEPHGRTTAEYCITCGKKLPPLDKRGRPIYES